MPQGDALPPEAGETRPGSKDDRIEPYREMLGSVPDSDVAKKAGVSVRTIASFRSRNQISGYKGRATPRKERKPRRSRIDPFAELVGKVPDRVVAEKAGVTLNAVRNYRAARGITSSRQRSRELRDTGPADITRSSAPVATASEVTASQPRPLGKPQVMETAVRASVATGGFAWRVRFDTGSEGIVLGADIVEAAQGGRMAGNGTIVGIERLGSLI
ncbi:MAG: hypothetical protein R3F61_19465 [Myxococcota bacterium]